MSCFTRILILNLFLFIVFATCSGFADSKAPASIVTVQLSWKYQFEYAQVIAAYEKGFYKEAGLDVKILEGGPGIDPVEQVVNGKADFGIFSSALVVSYAEGKPVVALAALMQHSAVCLITRHDEQLRNIFDIEGKTIALSKDTEDEVLAYLKGMGLDMSGINLIDRTGIGLTDLDRADATSSYISNEGYEVLGKDELYHVFYPRTSGVDLFGNILFTTRELVKRDMAQVNAFVKATLRGLEYSFAHTGEIIDIILEHYNTQGKSRDHLIYEARKIHELTRPDIVEPGYMSLGRWKHVVEIYVNQGKIEADIDLAPFVFDPNPEINMIPYYWMLYGLAVLLIVVSIFLWQAHRYNGMLRTEIKVREKTEEELRLAKKQADSASDAKSRFLSSMSHELRTPLNAILGFSQVIELDDNSEDTKRYARNIVDAGNLLLAIINELLDLAKIESGKIEIVCEKYSLNDLVDECLLIIRPLARNRVIKIDNNLDQSNIYYVNIDVTRFKQILLNILSNAVKYNSDNGIITIYGEVVDNNRYCLSINDTGKGLTEEQQIDLFKPFDRVGAENSNIEGTGLGLSIAKQLIELMGGEIGVESTIGQGCRFWVLVPLLREHA